MKILYLFFFLSFLMWFGCDMTTDQLNKKRPSLELTSLRIKAEEALAYCRSNRLNTDLCILIEMSLHSGVKRFVVWDFNTSDIVYSCLVSHGCGNKPWGRDSSKSSPRFSNTPDSHCTSLGRYRIGERGYSNWGVHTKYLLHGLDPTNSNALRRHIVFHSWEQIPNEETYPDGTPEGWGCPAISNESFWVVDRKLRESGGKVMMWVYE